MASTIASVRIPTSGDVPDVPADFLRTVTDLLYSSEPTFSSTGTRDTYFATVTLTAGQRCRVAGNPQRYNGSAWRPRLGNEIVQRVTSSTGATSGASVAAGATTLISQPQIVTTAPARIEFDCTLILTSAGTCAGSIRLNVAGYTRDVRYHNHGIGVFHGGGVIISGPADAAGTYTASISVIQDGSVAAVVVNEVIYELREIR